jgi:lipopolysaccharide/colanic/teichoic acid biosynthesis glycosyltransferase
MLKRVFDLSVGLFALTLALPLMALSVLMVHLEDGAPVIFRQKRVGKNGYLFTMFKIRTMVKNAEQLQSQAQKRDVDGNLIHKTKDDPRVTRVGRVLRRFSLDELPQLFNVLGGTMSLVGPRPEIPYLADEYAPWQRKRFDVLPGMTGWWQIRGRSDRPMHLHTEDDLYI